MKENDRRMTVEHRNGGWVNKSNESIIVESQLHQ